MAHRTKIAMITYYGFKAPLSSAAEALRNMGYTVVSYPLFQYAHDVHDRREDVVDHMVDFLTAQSIGIVFWWCISIGAEQFATIINRLPESICHFFYNWDDPYAWRECTGNQLAEKSKYFDCVLTCCKASIQRYRQQGVKYVGWSLPGHDESTFRPRALNDIPERFHCDVSICCTNVYDNPEIYPDQLFPRKQLILAMCKAAKEYNFVFKVFGPEHLKAHLPDADQFYAGYCAFEDTALLFSASKVNLCTHVDASHYGYSNERVVTVLGCRGGVLLLDGIPGIDDVLEPGVDAVVVHSVEEAVSQVITLLSDVDLCRTLSASGYRLARERYTWHQWAKRAHRLLSQYFWDAEEYAAMMTSIDPAYSDAVVGASACWRHFNRRLDSQFTAWSFIPPRPSDFDGTEQDWRQWLQQSSEPYPKRILPLPTSRSSSNSAPDLARTSSNDSTTANGLVALNDMSDANALCALKLTHVLQNPAYLWSASKTLLPNSLHSLIVELW